MRTSRLTSRHLINEVQIIRTTSETPHWLGSSPRQLSITALERPSASLGTNGNRNLIRCCRSWTSVAFEPQSSPRSEFCDVSQRPRWKKLAMLGQGDMQRSKHSTLGRNSLFPKNTSRPVPDDDLLAVLSSCPSASMRLARIINRGSTNTSIWEIFELIQKDQESDILSSNEAQMLRDEVLTAALANNSWLNVVVDTAHRLLAKYGFAWPELYMKIMHHMLENRKHEDTLRWHFHLAPKFLPSADKFGAILSGFILDSSPRTQSSLMALYISSTEKGVYDHIIPILFAAGRSISARRWRKTLLVFGDFPKSKKSAPFLHFLKQYYPSIPLTDEEIAVTFADEDKANTLTDEERAATQVTDLFIKNTSLHLDRPDYSGEGQYSDGIVAKWFASSWISVDFAINLAQRLGLRVMGPRSLQSLALREPGAKMLALRLACIEKLGITVSSKNYCKVLTSFAKHEEDVRLAEFLNCDIHPDEFDDVETRRMLMAASARTGDWRRQRLLQDVEWAIESETSSRRLNDLIQRELATCQQGRARQVLDRMEALKAKLNPQSASQLLMGAFRQIGKNSSRRKCRGRESQIRVQLLLTDAIEIIRRIASHNFAIPFRYWKLLLCNLGRAGRLDELQQLSEEIVRLYSPFSGGLVPICCEDLPRCLPKTHNATHIPGDPSRLSMCGKHVGTTLRQEATPSSCPTLRNRGIMIADRSRHRRNEATRVTMACSSPDSIALKNVSRDMKPRTKVCGNGDCLMMRIPTDLSLSHQQHPVQQIFDAAFQRSIVRWAFDQRLDMSPPCPSLEELSQSGSGVCDITCGVRLLARLRDLGVAIDVHLLRTVVLSKIALCQVPGRRRNRSRDSHELSLERLKHMFDEAWGSEILPNTLEMSRQIDKQKPKLWDSYSKLFERSFNKCEKLTYRIHSTAKPYCN